MPLPMSKCVRACVCVCVCVWASAQATPQTMCVCNALMMVHADLGTYCFSTPCAHAPIKC